MPYPILFINHGSFMTAYMINDEGVLVYALCEAGVANGSWKEVEKPFEEEAREISDKLIAALP